MNLQNDELSAVIDPQRGGEVVSLRYRPTDLDVLFSTPWRRRADLMAETGAGSAFADDQAEWLERYRGGWQTLAPTAGPRSQIGTASVGFHGELSRVPFVVLESSDAHVRMETELVSVPLLVTRTISLAGGRIVMDDLLTNLSGDEVLFDYVSHPAFSRDLLEGDCVIELGATSFRWDGDATRHDWPHVTTDEGDALDLTVVPPVGSRRAAFGWASDFVTGSATLRNTTRGVQARVEWDEKILNSLWLWQELEGTVGFPWFRRARVVALEPSSTPTTRVGGAPALTLAGGAQLRVRVSLTIERTYS